MNGELYEAAVRIPRPQGGYCGCFDFIFFPFTFFGSFKSKHNSVIPHKNINIAMQEPAAGDSYRAFIEMI